MALETLWVFWKRHQHQAGYFIIGILLFAAGWQFGRVTSPYYASHPIVFQEAPGTSPDANAGSVEALVALKEAGEGSAQVAAAITTSPEPSMGESILPSSTTTPLPPPQTPPPAGGETPDKIYVGSKNSDLYHYKTCSSASRIKEENQIWWPTREAAEAAGYKPSKCTIDLNTTN